MSMDIPQQGIPFWIKNLILQETSRAFQSRQWNERVKGIEPSYAAWEAAVLPLNYTRMDNRAATPFGRQHTPSPVQITT